MQYTDNVIGLISSEDVIARMKSDLKNKANKLEGSFASDNIQAVGKEVANLYSRLNYLNDMHYTETAEGVWLDKDGMQFGVDRKKATKAIGEVTFYGKDNTVIPSGFIVSSGDLDYQTTQYVTISDGKAVSKVIALMEGSLSNVAPNMIDKHDTLQGLERVTNEKEITGGTDEEQDEDYRERILIKKRFQGTSGNIYHYLHWALEVDGVGRAKVFPLWQGAGTVKVSILDANQKKANEDLVLKVKTHIDGGADRNGEALAPIGALLTVSTAEEVILNINANVILRPEIEAHSEMVEQAFKEELQIYIDKNISYKDNKLTVAKMIDILYSVEGIEDIENFKVNNSLDTIRIGEEEILKVGEVSFNG